MVAHKGYTVQDYIDRAARGLSMSEAAREMGVSRQVVWKFARKYGIEFTMGKKGRRPSSPVDAQ